MNSASRTLLTGGLLLALAGCKAKVEVRVLSDESPARRSAASFVHCIEAGTEGCVSAENISGGWDAFYLLTWLADGSPVSVMYALPGELAAHQDPREVERRLVAEVERYSNAVRGAECNAVDAQQFTGLIDKAAAQAMARMTLLGMMEGNLRSVIGALAKEAHEGLDGGELVRLDCEFNPYRIYLASQGFDDGVQRVVGMSTMMPPAFGGDVPARDVVNERLHSRALGLDTQDPPVVDGSISPWLPFDVELF